jgi:FAD/FMN-containing dehydrogenase
VSKVGGDLIVPFDQLPAMLRAYGDGFRARGLEWAVWGHLSDGNLHPNALPHDADEVRLAYDAQREFADRAARAGGCPLSEHGVGRNRFKQELLRGFLGEEAVPQMRAIKRAFDPDSRLAPGVLFPADP